jgi:hypothetical protein
MVAGFLSGSRSVRLELAFRSKMEKVLDQPNSTSASQTPFLKPYCNSADTSVWSAVAGGRALDAARASRGDQSAREA